LFTTYRYCVWKEKERNERKGRKYEIAVAIKNADEKP
jgi:hypothetical protein